MFAAEILQQIVICKENFLCVHAFSCFCQNIYQPLKYRITLQRERIFYHVDIFNAIPIDGYVNIRNIITISDENRFTH